MFVRNINTKKYTKGFTLVELLIAISLIAILSAVLFSVLNPRGIQGKARDSQRVSDLSKIKIALESYFADNRGYPTTGSNWELISQTSGTLWTALVNTGKLYINVLPVDPKLNLASCNVNQNWRGYYYKSNGSVYVLATRMETASSAVATCPVSSPANFCNNCMYTYMTVPGYRYYTTAD